MNPKLVSALAALFAAPFALASEVKHNYDLTNVLWKLSFQMEKGTVAGEVTNTVTLNEDSKTVEFHCEQLNVSKVVVFNTPAKFSTADGKLTVTLPKPGKAGQSIPIRTIYSGAPTNGFYFVPAYRAYPAKTPMIYTQGQGEDNHFWLPTYDKPDDKATTEGYITVPKGWTAISNGKLIGITKTKAGPTFHWKMDQPHVTYLISIVAGPYEEVKTKWRSTPVSFYVPPGLVKEGQQSFGATPKMIECFSKLTGVPYPYPKFAQEVVGDFLYGGMENITAVTQTIKTLHGLDTEPIADSTYLVAHELAHQWFGDLMTCKTWEHSWVNEGFATTMPMFYNRETRGEDQFVLDRYRNFEGAVDTIGSRGRKDVAGEVGSVPTVTMGSVYDGGCSRIMMIYHRLGEETFWKAINRFLVDYSYKNATTDDFFQVMEQVSGQDFDDFVKQWYHTSSTPSLFAKMDGKTLVVNQLSPYYTTLDLPVWVWNNGDWAKKEIKVTGKESRLDLGDLAGKPFLIDPEVWTPMELKYEIPFSPQDIATLYAHAPNVAQKARIITFLFDTIPVAQRIGIGHTEKWQGLLAMMPAHIPQEGASFLLELTKNPDPRVVNAAVLQIANLQWDPNLAARMNALAETSPNELIRERATQALLNWAAEPDLAKKAWTMKAFDDGYRVMALDWFGKHQPDVARKMALDFIAKPNSEPVRIKAVQVLGVVKEAPGETRVFQALTAIAKETSFWARNWAIDSLGKLGNRAAIPVLQPITKSAPFGIRGKADQVIAELQKK